MYVPREAEFVRPAVYLSFANKHHTVLRFFTSLLLLFLSVLFIVSCDNGLEEVTEQDEYGNTIRFERRKTDFAREGWSYTSNPDGVIVEAAQYHSDTLNGLRIIFNDSGDTSIVEQYDMGKFVGEYRLYHDNGVLKQRGSYVDNQMTGDWETYYDNAQLKERVRFAENMENGPFIEYHPNGKLAAEGAYIDGDYEHGELKIYNENGELQRTMMCDRGRCTTTWKAEETEE